MTHIRRDLSQRFQHKSALAHTGMRNRQTRVVDNQTAKQQNVDVDNARTFFLRSLPPHLLLNLENPGEQFLRRSLRNQRNSTIQKPSLRGEFHRFGFVERRNRGHVAQSTQAIDSYFKIFRSLPNIRPQRKIDQFPQVDSLPLDLVAPASCRLSRAHLALASSEPGIQFKTCLAER